MENKLISMTDFVLEQNKFNLYKNSEEEIRNYANFLKQPLEKGMFVPCDEDGNVLEEPKSWNDYLAYPDSFDGNIEWYELYAYEQAKEKVIFKECIAYKPMLSSDYYVVEFNYTKVWLTHTNRTIENLIPYNLTLIK